MNQEMTAIVPKRNLSGSTLKLIGICTMLIDHVAAVLLVRLILDGYWGMVYAGGTQTIKEWLQDHVLLHYGYYAMRAIGRIAFPIFIFLLIEGFEKTGNRWKYAMRLGMFALLSEIPFDLAFRAEVLEFTYQNIFFTLLIGFLAMMLVDAIQKKPWGITGKWILEGICIALAACAAELLQTDYGAKGIIGIMAMFLFRKRREQQILAGSIAFLWELPAPLAFIPISHYNGKRGWKLKYVFYAFYPIHLLVIHLLCVALGIHKYAVV